MAVRVIKQIATSSESMLQEQYAHLCNQIPLMYALMLVNAVFLGTATYGDVPIGYSVGVPALLCTLILLRLGIWLSRRSHQPTPGNIRRYLYGAVIVAAALSAAFGGWGLLLLDEASPVRSTSIALYVFVGAISACYCLQALPLAGWLVIILGVLPITIRLLLARDWYLAGIGLIFLLAAGVIIRTLASSFAAFQEVVSSRSELGALVEALQNSEEHYRHSVDLNPQIPWISDPSGAAIELSPRWEALTGLDLKSSLGRGWAKALHPDDVSRVQEVWQQSIDSKQGKTTDTRYRLRQKNGSYRWYRARAFPRFDAQGAIRAWYGNLEDIDDQVKAERAFKASEERYRLASMASNDVIWDVSLEQDRIEWGGMAAEVFGYDDLAEGTSRRWWIERLHPQERSKVLRQVRRLRQAEGAHWTLEFRFRVADGTYLDLTARGNVVRDDEGRSIRLIGTLRDVTARRRYESELRRAAYYDSLTGLPNRVLFAERLEAALEEARRDNRHVALVVFDVDRFKVVNDSLGHDAGDALLCEIALRLAAAAPSPATVARLGGDEFAIILPALADPDLAAADIAEVFARVAGSLSYRGRQIDASLSAGSALSLADGQSSEELRKSADLALYTAKREGLGRLCSFRSDMRDAAARHIQMLSDARSALHDDRVVPFYQPKICLNTGVCVGFEALLRWHDHRGLQPPGQIQAAFDDPSLSVQLTDHMLACVIADMCAWREHDVAFHSIAINGSAGDFMRGDFADRILSGLHKAGLPPSSIELEVTETVFLGQLADIVSAALDTLADAGVKIALDDFGTGYASLMHLKQFPVDTLKIDRCFVSTLGDVETHDAAIVGAIIDLARNMDICTVAEGIETPVQLRQLIGKGCDIGQGYLFGRPMAAGHVAQTTTNWNKGAIAALCEAADWDAVAHEVHQGKFR